MVKKTIGQTAIWTVLILMYLPILVIIAFSFTKSDNIGDWQGFSFESYADLFKNTEIMIALGNTLIIALVSSIIAVIIGTLGAVGAYYSKNKSRAAIEGITQIPVVNAEIVTALSLTVMFVAVGGFLTFAFDKEVNIFSFWTLLFGHLVLSTPFVYLNVKPKLQQMDPSLYEAALDLGCTPAQALNKVVLPEIVPGIMNGFLMAFTLSLDDYVVTAFTRGPGLLSGDRAIQTLSTLIQSKIKKGPIPHEMRPLTTIIFLVVLAVVIGFTIYQNVKAKQKPRQNRNRGVQK